MVMKSLFSFFCLLFLSLPVYAEDKIVEPREVYTYEHLREDISQLQARYGEILTVRKIGTSFFGKEIPAVKLGKGNKHILMIGAHHGREWITSSLLMNMLETYAKAYQDMSPLGSFSPAVFDEISIWFVPMLNPDGVSIQQGKLEELHPSVREYIYFLNKGSSNLSRWKANGQGIDLNRQYPAGWDELPGEPSRPSYKFYKGTRPVETNETQAIVRFTYEAEPLVAVSYHSSGREIFWKYYNKFEERDRKLAGMVSKLTGYKLSKPPSPSNGGGYTDWFITAFSRPCLTIEICPPVEETAPPLSIFDEEWRRNQFVGVLLAEEAKKLLEQEKSNQAE